MQTIVNLVSAGLGIAWVPQSVQQFQRPGVVYRAIDMPASQSQALKGRLSQALAFVPECETSLVWSSKNSNPATQRFIAFVDQIMR